MKLLALIVSMLIVGCPSVQKMPEGNGAAYAENGDACVEENQDLLSRGWSEQQLHELCDSGTHWGSRYIIDNCRRCNWECCSDGQR